MSLLRQRFVILLFASATLWSAVTYEVGTGQAYTTIGAVPWESLNAGDTVRIHYSTTPYREKWVINRQGTQAAPIRITGVLGPNGERPLINGENATTRSALDYWARNRGVIKVGGASTPGDAQAAWVLIENLDITSARPPYTFRGPNGATESYSASASAIYIETASNITVRNCILRNSGNGFFVAYGPSSNITLANCHLYDNGNADSVYEHNSYTETRGMIYEGNRFGPLRAGCLGNNLKDRSSGTVIRYNHIEGGNRQLDLVESEDYAEIRNDASYRTTFAYGNVLVEPSGAGNRQIIHYGGDGGDESYYRRGTLYFHDNTVVSNRTDRTVLVRLSTSVERMNATNNIIHTSAAGNTMYMLEDNGGTMSLTNCWLKTGWQNGVAGGTVTATGVITGTAPGFVNEGSKDYHLAAGSPCLNRAAALPAAVLPAHNVVRQYVAHQQTEARANISDIGGYCFSSSGGNQAPAVSTATATPATVTGTTTALAAAATDDGGEAALTYTWSGSPSTVSFSPNGSNAAKNATATFTAAGTYTLTVTARDAGGLTATRTVTVTVQRTATTVTPGQADVTVETGATASLSAQVRDQFGAIINGSAISWSMQSGGGSVTAAGVYTAPAATGTAVVRAASGAASATIEVQIVAANAAPVVSAATATPATVAGTTTALSATASDDGGEAALTYTWSASPGTVAFGPNGTNAARNTSATFIAAGTYTCTVTVRDAGNRTATRTVTVTVQQTATTVTPGQADVTVDAGANVNLSAQVRDQFGNLISGAGIAWSIQSGGGTVSAAGIYTAPAAAGDAVIRAASGAASAAIQVHTVARSGSTVHHASGSGGGGCGSGMALGLLLLSASLLLHGRSRR